MTRWFPGFSAVVLALLIAAACGEEPASIVSRVPPAAYQELLAPHLTKLEDVRLLPKAPTNEKGDTSTETLLDESILYLHDDGRHLVVTHLIHEVLTEAGVKYLGEEETSFLRSKEKLHVALARTIRPDGSSVHAEEKGMFLKRTGPKEGTMHTDRDTLHIVFPDVTVGSVVELIYVREVSFPTIPGEFIWSNMGSNLGGTRRQRVVIDSSENLLSRLRWDGLGMTLPDPEKTPAGEGRVLLKWQLERLRPFAFENGAPPAFQVGPMWRFGTVRSWDEIGKWFAGLIRENEGSGANPQTTAREWAAGANKPREIAQKLFDNVQQQVRYTGLEFGKGSHQPRSPEDVLSTRYGDCKDKANLLRVLLREHGIDSRIALLNTIHAGYVDRKFPSPYQFNHAILAVKLPGSKEYQFCDPSLDGIGFGLLHPGDVDRDTLLVNVDGSVEWARTPAQNLGRQDITVDFELEPGGGFSGWFTVKATGYFGALIANDLAKATRNDALTRLARIYFGNMEGAFVLDYELLKDAPGDARNELHVRVYMVKDGAALEPDAESERAIFPQLLALLPLVGETALRTTPMRGLAIESRVQGGYRLPEGWKVLDKPGAFKRTAGTASFAATWSTKEGRLNFDATAITKDLVISPDNHDELWNARRDMIAWAGRPVLIKIPKVSAKDGDSDQPEDEEEEEGTEAKPWSPPADKLPKLATSQGQLALVDKRFPFDPNNPFEADHNSRKIAMQKVVEFFPEDHVAQFQARIVMIVSKLFELETENLADEARELIGKYSNHIEADYLAAGKLMLAAALIATEKNEEALPLVLELADGDEAQAIRRASAIMAGTILSETDPQRAATYARRALADGSSIPTPALAQASAVVILGLVEQPGITPDAILKEWQALATQFRSQGEILRRILLGLVEGVLEEGEIEDARLLAQVTAQVLESARDMEEERARLKEYQAQIDRAKSYTSIHEKLAAKIRALNWPDMEKIEPGHKVDTVSNCSQEIDDTEAYDIRIRYALRRLTSYGPQPDFAEHLLETAEIANVWLANVAEKKPSTPEAPKQLEQLIDLMLETGMELRGEIEGGSEFALLKGEVIKRRSGNPAALQYYRSLTADKKASEDLRSEAHEAAAELLADAGDFRGVLAEWRAMESLAEQDHNGHLFLRTVYLNLIVADYDEAWRRVAKFVDGDKTLTKSAEKANEIFSEMLKDKPAAEAWWKQSNTWWSKWEALCPKIGLADTQWQTRSPWGTWMSPLERLPDLEKTEDDPDDSSMLASVIQNIMNRARWHRELAGEAVTLLREHIAKKNPASQTTIEELAHEIESATKAH